MKKKNQRSGTIEYILLFISLLAVIAIIVLQIYYSEKPLSQLDMSLFSILQFIFSILFGWLITRVVTKNEYYESIKEYGLSAYRRISDIRKSLVRLGTVIEKNRGRYLQEIPHELDVIGKIVEDINDTVASSIADWGGIIGDEIKTSEQIEDKLIELQDVFSLLNENNEETQEDEAQANLELEYKNLKEEIEGLKEKLPSELQIKLDQSMNIPISQKVYKQIDHQIEEFKEIHLKARLSNLPFNNFKELKKDETVNVILMYVNKTGEGQSIDVLDKVGDYIGKIVNSQIDENVSTQEYLGSICISLFQNGMNPSVILGRMKVPENMDSLVDITIPMENIGPRG